MKRYFSKIFNKKIDQKIQQIMNLHDMFPITQTSEEDVFIVGFPKSGNTWMQSLITMLVYGIHNDVMSDKMAQFFVTDMHYSKYYRRFGKTTYFKTHGLPTAQYKKVIYIVRDGRDAILSYYQMNKKQNKDVSLQDMILDGKEVFPCSWDEHVRIWMKNPYHANILWIRYEDLLANGLQELKKISVFLGLERSSDQIKNTMEGCEISKMKNREKFFGLYNKTWKSSESFFGSGKVGSHLQELPKALINSFNERSYNELRQFNYLE